MATRKDNQDRPNIADVLVRGMIDAAATPAKPSAIGIGDGAAAEVIESMFVEETGTHPLDSGSDGGRHWQENKQVHPSQKPRITFRDNDFDSVVVNTCRQLLRLVSQGELERDGAARRLEHEMYRWVAKDKGENLRTVRVHCGDYEAWAERIGGQPHVFNTYNTTEFNDQTLQGALFDSGGEHFVILQVHQGADVRGGYTNPRIFQLGQEGSLDMSEVTAYCRNCGFETHTYNRDQEQGPVMRKPAEEVDGWGGVWPHCPKCECQMEVQV